MELQIIVVEEIVDQFFIEYAHQEQLEEQNMFFQYNFPRPFSHDDKRRIAIEIMNSLSEQLMDFSVSLDGDSLYINTKI